jgi:hypothetical protein
VNNELGNALHDYTFSITSLRLIALSRVLKVKANLVNASILFP